MDKQSLPIRALAIGFVCGMRSMLGPAQVRPILASSSPKGAPVQSAAASPIASALMPFAAAGEFVGDKLPNTPDRIALPSVIFRSASGGGCGAALYHVEDQPIVVGAALGVVGALLATYGIFYLRRAAGEKGHVPNLILGIIEDGAALALGAAVVH